MGRRLKSSTKAASSQAAIHASLCSGQSDTSREGMPVQAMFGPLAITGILCGIGVLQHILAKPALAVEKKLDSVDYRLGKASRSVSDTVAKQLHSSHPARTLELSLENLLAAVDAFAFEAQQSGR